MTADSGKSIFYSGNKNIYYSEKFADRISYLKKKMLSDYRSYSKFPIARHIRRLVFQWQHRLKDFSKQKNKIDQADVLLVGVPKHGTDAPPLALAYLKGYLQKEGKTCKCIDFNIKLAREVDAYSFNVRDHSLFLDGARFEQFCREKYFSIMDKWVEEILSYNPKYVGLSLIWRGSMPTAVYMARSMKKAREDITIIVGGPHCKKLLSKPIEEDYADIVVLGEGYEPISKIAAGEDLNHIGSIIFKKNHKIFQSPEKSGLAELDKLPFPDFSDFDLRQYSNSGTVFRGVTLPINASLGCTRNCTFCTYSFFMGRFKARSARSVFEEMRYQKYRHGTCRFSFMDGMINADVKFLEELCDLIIGNDEIFYWTAQFGFKENVTDELISKLSRAGCSFLSIGLESGSEKVRKDMLKPCSNTKVDEFIKALHKQTIPFNLNFLIGYPTETESDFCETLELIKKHHSRIASVTPYITHILTGTILSKIALENKEYSFDPKEASSWVFRENTPQLRDQRMQRITEMAIQYNLIPKTASGMF